MSIRVGATREPKWYDLRDGVRVQLRPFDAALEMQAVAAARPGDLAPIDEDAPDAEARGFDADYGFTLRFTLELAKRFIVAWEGVVDQDDQTAPINEVTLTEVIMLVPGMARYLRSAFDEHFLTSEKKGLRVGQNGAGPAATPTVAPAPTPERRVPKGVPAPTASSAPSSPTAHQPK